MNKHPYPPAVVDRIQNAYLQQGIVLHGPLARELADVALEAFWGWLKENTK